MHASPLAEVSDVGNVLQKAGFALPATDTDSFKIRFPDAVAVMLLLLLTTLLLLSTLLLLLFTLLLLPLTIPLLLSTASHTPPTLNRR